MRYQVPSVFQCGVVGLLILAAGCANTSRIPPNAPQRPAPVTPALPAAAPAPAAGPAPAAESTVQPAGPAQPTAAKPPITNTARAAAVAAVPASAPTPRAVKPPNGGKASAGAAAKSTTPATLDLTSLEQRLRDTRAIGVLTKLSLKNQVDDLLDQVRAYHHGDRTMSLADLQQSYNQLLLKVLGLLQNADAPLAAAISSSRDAIWAILSDPDKFAKI